MGFFPKQRRFSKGWLKDYSLIVIGAFILALGFVYFIVPHNIVPGGVYGVAIMVHHLTQGMFDAFPEGLPVGMIGLSIDIPLTIIGIKILGPKFGIKTILGFILLSFFLDGIEMVRPDSYEPLVDDMLLSSVFGGLVCGFGLGLIFKSKATSGGTDIIAMILKKYSSLPLGQLMMYVDSVIILSSLIVFKDWEKPLYGWIVVYILGKVIDATLQGNNVHKAVLVISEKHEEIKSKILVDLDRGGTYINGTGLYTGNSKQIIFTVIPRREVMILHEHIHRIDPDAFITVMDASEIYGEGFQSLQNKIEE